jgi:hypothetical protein
MTKHAPSPSKRVRDRTARYEAAWRSVALDSTVCMVVAENPEKVTSWL